MAKIIINTLIIYFFSSISVLSQSKIIEDFMKKHSSKDGVTYVAVSPKMCESVFGHSKNISYYSLTVINEILNGGRIYQEFEKQIRSTNYEQYFVKNSSEETAISYYQKAVNDTCNEIFIISKQLESFSAIYMKGNIETVEVSAYLSVMRTYLKRLDMGFLPLYDRTKQFDSFSFEFPNFDLGYLNDISKQLSEIELPDFEKLKENMKSFGKDLEKHLKDFQFDSE